MSNIPEPQEPNNPENTETVFDDSDDKLVKATSSVPSPLSGALSLFPGLGQIVTGHITRGLLIGFFIISIFGLSWWRLNDEDIRLSVFGITIIDQEPENVRDVASTSIRLSNDVEIIINPEADIFSADETESDPEEDSPTAEPTQSISSFAPPSSNEEPTPAPTEAATETAIIPTELPTEPASEVIDENPTPSPTSIYTEYSSPGADEPQEADESLETTEIGIVAEEVDGEAIVITQANIGDLKLGIFPFISMEGLTPQQRDAAWYVLLASLFALVAYIWNIYDGYVCATNPNGAPPSLGLLFIILGTLTIGSDITEINISKAIREISDIGPRLSVILWPWDPDEILEYDIETFDARAPLVIPSADVASCPENSRDCVLLLRQNEILDLAEQLCSAIDINAPPPLEGEPFLSLSPNCGLRAGPTPTTGARGAGTTITVSGGNLRPNESAELWIAHPYGEPFRPRTGTGTGTNQQSQVVNVITDNTGAFSLSFMIPNNIIYPEEVEEPIVVEVIVRQTREVGDPYLVNEFWLSLEGIVETLFLALMATAAGLVLAVPMSFLAARNLMSTSPATMGVYYVIRVIMNVVRSIEPIIWALIAIIWVGPGAFAGVIALTIHTIAALGKLYSESIESIDDGPIEALQATGANRLQTIIFAVVPQIVPPFVSFTIYRWDINVRMSTIIGAVGGGGIGVFLIQWIRLGDNHSVGIAVWMIAIVVTVLDYASSRIREAYT